MRDARRLTTMTGRGIVEPALTTGVVRGDPDALAKLDRIIRRRVLAPDVARVKIWNAEGKILYSDEPPLIGRRFTLGADELSALRVRSASTESVDISEPGERLRAQPGRPDLGLLRPPRPGRHARAL